MCLYIVDNQKCAVYVTLHSFYRASALLSTVISIPLTVSPSVCHVIV